MLRIEVVSWVMHTRSKLQDWQTNIDPMTLERKSTHRPTLWLNHRPTHRRCNYPLSWDTRDASKWIFWTEHQYHLPPLGEAFAGLDGRALNSLSEEQFCEMAIGSSGPILHAQMEIWRTVLHLSLSKHVSSLKGCCSDTQTICQGKAYPASQPIHLWQFLRELLLRPEMYSHLIRWLNQEKGIFKIEDSAQVARLWGERKNRPAMNYDKLSRSIRQYYKKGIIRKTRISQRLVYQFVCPRR
uniref:SAM pointed domain-containing Ets transcription factor isoform X1 n=1 Tax=Myxine glutinosa TaxID=7769 RepID=UPI0035902BB9